ncbi:pickpocket protein 28-like [Onthophagus taurus]|uniref:pickpocket protein 28-like n=1 Tax=Onthophagus taurus TaxID=166361 RepID=UPI000C201816|nr:pickpocket protein 28-like [Onthophagus taurus]
MTVEKNDQIFEENLKPKKKYPGFVKNLRDYFSEYTSSTSLHGFQYLGDQNRTIPEKIFWTVVISACLSICTMMILKTHDKWTNSPVIVSFAQSPTPVGAIAFPAVTICSETKSRQTVFNFTSYYHRNRKHDNLTEEENKMYEDASLLCDTHVYLDGSKTTDFGVIDFFEEIAPPYKEIFMSCTWQDRNETCDTLFYKMLSEEGICYTFNMLNRDAIYTNEVFHNKDFLDHNREPTDWTLESGYTSLEDDEETYPFRVVTAGAKAGITILLKANENDLDYVCRGPVQGFKVALHPPDEVPRVGMQFFRLPLDQEVVVAIKPDMMTTSSSLLGYDPKKRGCYFSHERKLRYYNTYSQQNCYIECLTNVTLNMCGCVAYHMPHSEHTQICGSGSTACMKNARTSIVSSVNSTESGCNCLQACTAVTYNAETSQADFNWVKVLEAYENEEDFTGTRMARMTLFYKEMQVITSERNELYGITDFMANCGGLLGLFIGFSFVSLIETLYFMTLRLLMNILKFGRHFWSASDDLLQNDAYLHPYKDKKNEKDDLEK